MKSFLSIMGSAAALGILVAIFGPYLGFHVNQIGVIAGGLAVGLVVWIVWHAVPAESVSWPGESAEPARRSVSEWALETLLADALRGSERSLRELARRLADLTEGRDDLSPALSEFTKAARDGHAPPRINRRDLHHFLKEITP